MVRSLELQTTRLSVHGNSATSNVMSTVRGRDSPRPVDGGKDAWLFLAACFVMEALVWGFPFAFGVFQDYYRTHEPFTNSSHVAVVGTCAIGLMYLSAPILMLILRLYPQKGRYAPALGLVIMCGGLAASSFSQTVAHLILSQGIVFAIGGSICYSPCIIYLDEWFEKRKGFAYGVMWSGTGLGGFTIPPLLNLLLRRYGFRNTLRIWAISLLVLILPLIYFIKPRLPASRTTCFQPQKLRFILNRTFLLYQLSNVVEGFGFFLPGLYLPSYARTILGAGSDLSSVTILILNVATVFGCIGMGILIDHLHVNTCIMISTVGAVIGTFLLWGFATHISILYIFCIVYGLFAGAWTSTYTGITKRVIVAQHRGGLTADSSSDPVMVLSFMAAGRGIGNIISGPLSEILLESMPWHGQAVAGYGSGYGSLIIFTGATAAVGGMTYLWSRLGWI